jgi:Icc-related predicted phosphoesterase
MPLKTPSLLAVLCLLAAPARADEPSSLATWEDAYQFDCNAPWKQFDPPEQLDFEGFHYALSGGVVKVTRLAPRPHKTAALGLLAGIKDLEPETQALLTRFLADFEKADVDAIIVGGDTQSEPEPLLQILEFVAKGTKRPVLVIAGNMERAGALSFAINAVRKGGRLNLLNMDLSRRYDGEGFDLVSLAGYHDKMFLHVAGGCIYQDKNLDEAERAAASANDPVVFLSHGPPRQHGQRALDFVPGVDNVGDARLTDLLKRAKISFGVFGHILEAGGTGTDLAGHPLPTGKFTSELYVNQGSANPLPWKLNDGSTSYGLAAVLTLDGKKARYDVLRGAKPAPRGAP